MALHFPATRYRVERALLPSSRAPASHLSWHGFAHRVCPAVVAGQFSIRAIPRVARVLTDALPTGAALREGKLLLHGSTFVRPPARFCGRLPHPTAAVCDADGREDGFRRWPVSARGVPLTFAGRRLVLRRARVNKVQCPQ